MAFTSNLDFTSGAQSADGPGAPSFAYTLPSWLDPSYQKSFSTTILGYTLAGSVSITAGLTGGIDLSLGQYTPNYPVQISVDAPTHVANGQVFTVDPTLVSTNDATFSLVGPSATVNLDLGIQGQATLAFNYPSTFEPSFSISTPAFSYGYALPTSATFSPIGGVSIVIAEPKGFNTMSAAGTAVGNLPTLTASGSDNNSLTASADFVALLGDVFPEIGALLSQTESLSGLGSLSYNLLSTPLSAGLALDQTVTLTPLGISVTLQEMQGASLIATDTGTLGQTFSFVAPSTGSGSLSIDATYTLELQVDTSWGVSGNLALSVIGPVASASFLGAATTIGPLFSFSLFDLSTGLGTVYSTSFDQSLTSTDTYDIGYGGAGGGSGPTIAAPAMVATGQGKASGIGGISIAETSAGPTETFTVTLTDTTGLLSATASGGASVTDVNSTSITISGTLADVNATLASLTDSEASAGTDSIAVAVTDSNSGSASTTVSVATNAAPVIHVSVAHGPSVEVVGVGWKSPITHLRFWEHGKTGAALGETLTVTVTDTNGLLFATGPDVSGAGTTSLTITGSRKSVSTALATLKDKELTVGSDTLVVNVTDSFGNSATEVTLPVTVNGPPVIHAPVHSTVVQNAATPITGLSVSEAGKTWAGFGETFTVTLTDTNGLLAATGAGVSGESTNSLTITGSHQAVNAALATLTDTEATTASDSLVVKVTDSFGNSAPQKTIAVSVSTTTIRSAAVTPQLGAAVFGQFAASSLPKSHGAGSAFLPQHPFTIDLAMAPPHADR